LHVYIAGEAILYVYVVCICRISYVYVLCVYCRRIYANPNLALTLSNRTNRMCTLYLYIACVNHMTGLYVYIVCAYGMCI
jgi:hypothetical protein